MKSAYRFMKEAFSGLPPTVWLLSLVNLINRSGTMILPFLPLYLTNDLGWSLSLSGFAVGCYGFGALVGSWLGGKLCDIFHGFHVMVFFLVGAGVLMFGVVHLRSAYTVIPGLIILGLISEGVRPSFGVMLTLCCPPELRPRGFTLLRLAINLGTAIGPAIGGFLAMHSYVWLFRVDGITCMLAALPLFLVPHGKALMKEKPPKKIQSDGSSVWGDGVFIIFFITVLITGVMFLQIWSTYPVFLKEDYGLTERHYGLIMSFNGVLIILTEMGLTHAFAGWRPLRVASIGMVVFALGLGMLPFGHGFVYALISVAVWTTGEMLIAPFLSTFVSLHAPKEQMGSYMGLYNMGWAGSFIIAPPMGAWVFEHWGSGPLWFGAFGIGVLAAVVCLALDRYKRRAEACK